MGRFILTNRSGMLIGVLFGLPIGSMLVLCIMGIKQLPIEKLRFMKFGDITIYSITRRDSNNGLSEELLMKKDGRLFLSVKKNTLGRLTDLILSNGRDNIILTLKPSSKPGKWVSANYGSNDLIGESYFDMNFDGHFDIKAILDAEVKMQRSIYFQHKWKQIDRFGNQKAISGLDTFVFDMNSGWQLEKAK